MTIQTEETIVWDNNKAFIENVLTHLQKYIDAQAIRGGDKFRLSKMLELRQLAESAKTNHNFVAVQDKARNMLDKSITEYGFFGQLGKRSYAYQILETIAKATISDTELQKQVTPFTSDTLQKLSAENAQLQSQLQETSSLKQKAELLEKSLANKEIAMAELEAKIQRLEQEKKAMVSDNMALQAEKTALTADRLDLVKLRDEYQTLVKEHVELRTQLAMVTDLSNEKKELKRQVVRLEAEIKLLRGHINDQAQLDIGTQETLKDAQSQVLQLQTKNNELKQKLAAFESQQTTAQIQQRLLIAERKNLQKQQAVQESETQLVPALQEIVDAATMENFALRQQIKAKDAKIATLESTLRENTAYYQKQVASLADDIKAREQKLNRAVNLAKSLSSLLRKVMNWLNPQQQQEIAPDLASLTDSLSHLEKTSPKPSHKQRIAFIAEAPAQRDIPSPQNGKNLAM